MRAGGKILTAGLCFVFALVPGQVLPAQGLLVSGILDSSVNIRTGREDIPAFSFGLEEYANLRLQTKIRNQAVFYGAVNFIAVTGTSAENAALLNSAENDGRPGLAPSFFAAGENYIAGFELERLYFRINGEHTDFDAGLMRLAFGYGQAFGPSDFLNPRNPLFPDARPRGILGGALSVYPLDDLKLLAYAAAPKDPFSSNGKGFRAGFMAENHWSRASVQGLYSIDTVTPQGLHRFGLSAKADLELGFAADLMYTLNPDASSGIEGLSASAGFDYSFLDGHLTLMAEYLYNGDRSVTAFNAADNLIGFSNHHYLYGMARYAFNDYTGAAVSLIAGLEDISFVPILSAEHELFQGCALTVTGQIPLDRDLFTGSGNPGEFGPAAKGAFILTARVRLRF
jgi:hypothetical protein